MIKAILFTTFFILLGASIGLIALLILKLSNEETEYSRIKGKMNEELNQWHLSTEEIKKIHDKYDNKLKNASKKSKYRIPLIASIFASVGFLLGVILIPGSFHQVNTGEVAVVRKLGKIVDIKNPGTYFTFYMTNKYEYYDTKVQQDKITTAAYSKDGQTMELEVFLQYQVQSENIMKIATEYGSLDALQARIETVTIEKTKAVMSSAEAMTIVQNRATFSKDVSETVRAGISDDYYVNVKDVVLTNIDFTDEFEKSVENKVIAEQDKQASITKAEAELEVAKLEAQKKIEAANGDAQAQLVIAQAAAKASASKFVELARTLNYEVTETESGYIVDTTTGAGSAQFKVLVEDYLQYLAYLEKWNGILPQVVSGDDAVSIIIPNIGE